jgi:creatinine deaminase
VRGTGPEGVAFFAASWAEAGIAAKANAASTKPTERFLIWEPPSLVNHTATIGGIMANMTGLDPAAMLQIALEEARRGLAEGGIPIGAALFDSDGNLLGRGHNRRVQEDDPSVHAETDAFRKAGRQRRYRDKIMATTLAPCWYCSGLVRQFRIGTVIVGESVNFSGGVQWLREAGVQVIDLHSQECIDMLKDFISANPEIWNEDIGED